jgi:hypothetical protein
MDNATIHDNQSESEPPLKQDVTVPTSSARRIGLHVQGVSS